MIDLDNRVVSNWIFYISYQYHMFVYGEINQIKCTRCITNMCADIMLFTWPRSESEAGFMAVQEHTSVSLEIGQTVRCVSCRQVMSSEQFCRLCNMLFKPISRRDGTRRPSYHRSMYVLLSYLYTAMSLRLMFDGTLQLRHAANHVTENMWIGLDCLSQMSWAEFVHLVAKGGSGMSKQ